jgi:hypothetical protein
MPVRLQRIKLSDCEALLVDRTEVGVPERSKQVWVHGVQGTLENVDTKPNLIRGKPSVLRLRAEVQRSGRLSALITADPLAAKLDFSGQISLNGLELDELYGPIASKTGVQAHEGTLDLSISFRCKDDTIEGGIKPALKNVELKAKDSDLGNHIKAHLAQAIYDSVSDRGPEHEAVLPAIPLKGHITDPNAKTWPTIIALLRKAYASGLSL